MTKNEKQELARRAVACKGWRWMPGMADSECRVATADGDYLTTASRDDGGSDWHKPSAMGLPDLADPATLGCLLALVREAWRSEFLGVVRLRPSPGWRVIAGGGCFDAPTEAESLVAALGAAP